MASNEDVAFLRRLVQNGFLDPGQASHCTQVLDQRMQRGEKVTALQVAMELGLVDPRKLEAEVKARAASQRMPAVAPGAPAASPAPSPPPAAAPAERRDSRRMARPGAASGDSRRIPRPGTASGASARLAPASPAEVGTPSRGAPRPGWGGAAGAQLSPGPGTSQSGRLATSREDARPAPGPGSSQYAPPPGPGSSQYAPPSTATSQEYLRVGASSTEQAAAPVALPELTDYEPSTKLGAGPVGPTFLARRRSDGAEVVLKLINPRFADHPELLDSVLRDLRAWSGFEAPGAAGPLALGSLAGQRVVVFPKLAPETLEQALTRGPLPPRQAMTVVQLVARALISPHGRGQGVGDVRAGKIYWDGHKGVLTDLGLSRASCLAAGFGQYGLIWGHPAYLAPEVLQEGIRRPTPVTDVYALGILLYQLVIGHLPYQGSVQEMLTKHLEAPLPPPPPGKVQVSTALAGLILRLTAKSPGSRLPDARAVAEALQTLLDRAPDGARPAAPKPAAAPLPKQAPPEESLAVEAPEQEEEPPAIAEPEEFNPVTVDEWEGLADDEGNKVSGRWSRQKIAEPVKVGPKDWDEASVDEANEKASLELRAALQAAVASRDKDGKPKAKPAARMVSGSGGGAGTGSTALAKYVGALLGVIAVLGVMSLWPKKKGPSAPPPVSGHTERVVYTPPTEAELAEQEQARQRLSGALAEFTSEVQREAEMHRFGRAVALLTQPPSGLEKAPNYGAALEETHRKVFQSIDDYLIRKVEKEFQDFVRVGELDAARRQLDGVAAWAERRPPYEALRRQLERLLRAKQDEVEQRGKEGEEIPVERVRMQVRDLLVGGGSSAKVYPNGGVIVTYKDAPAIQADLQLVYGVAPQLEPVPGQSGVNGLRLSRKPGGSTLLIHRLPMARPIDVTLELVVIPDPAPEKGAKVAILSGLSRALPQGLGTAWGLSPVKLLSTHRHLQELNSGITPTIEPGHRMSLEYTVDRTGHPQRFELGGALLDRDATRREKGAQVERSLDELRGCVGLFVEGCEVWITAMEVRGLIDPKLLEKPDPRATPAQPRAQEPARPPQQEPPKQAEPPKQPPSPPPRKPADKKPADQKPR